MTKSIGRNEPCPCGSGKKYKKCCLGKVSEEELLNEDEYKSFLDKWDNGFLLSVMGALQLLPENHCKNMRIEAFSLNLLANLPRSIDRPIPPYEVLNKFIHNHITHNHMEDPIEDFMTDRVIFINGNNIVFVGIQSDGAEVLNGLLRSIFLGKNSLSQELKNEIYAGVMLMLALGNSLANYANLKAFVKGHEESDDLFLPEPKKTIDIIEIVTFSSEEINDISNNLKIPSDTIESYVFSDFSRLDEVQDPNQNPLISRPLVKIEDNYIFVSPSNQVSSIIEFVYSKLTESQNLEEILSHYHRSCWSDIQMLFQENSSWVLTSLTEQISFSDDSPKFKSIWQFDHNKFCYAVYLGENDVKQYWEIDNPESHFESNLKKNEEIISSIEEDLQSVRKFKNIDADNFLILIVLGNTGRDMMFGVNKIGDSSDRTLVFGCFNLMNILYDPDKIDQLTLWKFSKAYFEATEKIRIMNYSLMAAYVLYKKNSDSLFNSDEARPDFMYVPDDIATEFRMESKSFRDQHHADIYRGDSIRGAYVNRRATFAKIYKAYQISKEYHLLVEDLGFPLWISYFPVASSNHLRLINNFCEAVAFWITKVASSIKEYFFEKITKPIHVILQLDDRFLSQYEQFEYRPKSENPSIELEIRNQHEIVINIPYDIFFYLLQANNEGERIIMERVLFGLDKIGVDYYSTKSWNSEIDEILDLHIPLGYAKMLLYLDVLNDVRIDNRWLPPSRFVQEHDISYVLDNLLLWSGEFERVPEKIDSIDAKYKLCQKIVEGLYSRLTKELSRFISENLLLYFIDWNERCLHDREFQSIQIPAKIACFSDLESEVESLQKKETQLVTTSLSLRCLIETIVANPVYDGTNKINIDDLDLVIAIMDEIITWGMFGDIVRLQIDNPEMGKLPSGRLGTDKGIIEKAFKPYQKAKLETDIDDYIDGFATNFRSEESQNSGDLNEQEEPDDVKQIDNAFKLDYGVTFLEVVKLFSCLVDLCQKNKSSSLKMEEQELINTVSEMENELDQESIKIILDLQSIKSRGGIDKFPKEYTINDIFPWVYNRRLSYIQKPICQVIADSKTYYYWGFRHLITSYKNTLYLIKSGKYKALPSNESGAISKLTATYREKKGIEFTRKVRQWFQDNTDYEVVEYEVKIGPKGHLENTTDLGDIDICLFDTKKKVLYSVECKNTVQAKIVHEMKSEMDNYLGRDGKPGMISKHAKRDLWLNKNKKKVADFLSKECDQIVSIVMTSEDIPITYLAQDKLPLPFISYPRLKRSGVPMEKYYVK